MLDTDDPALWYALNRLMTNYWAEVDHNGGTRAHEFYLPEARYAVGRNRFDGMTLEARVDNLARLVKGATGRNARLRARLSGALGR